MSRYQLLDTDLLCPVCRGDIPLLSRRIINRRTILGMSKSDLALRLGIHLQTVTRLEQGTYRPHRKVLLRVLSWLNLPDDQSVLSPSHRRSEEEPQ